MTARADVGMCFDRTLPAPLIREFAPALEQGGARQIWIIEDCFYTGGIALAATALAVTDDLTVGLGILPAVARAVPITAMEIATLCALGPGRVLAGIGHGVQSWMGQMGVRTPSPLTTLREVLECLRRLLAGEQVTFDGHQIHLDAVGLDSPPTDPPPLLAGVQGPKSLALAGQVADGVVLAEPASPSYVRWALAQASPVAAEAFHTATFSVLCVEPDRRSAYERMAPWLAGQLAGQRSTPTDAYRTLPFIDELFAWFDTHGVEGLVRMPAEWWGELAPIGTEDDALAHIAALESAGVGSIGLFPPADVNTVRRQLPNVVRLANR
ncbi:LLM class flavin-dependent oxidoreductase [Jatrophihabitans telluris]|uniref:LLM class flavin-dependent oxidoreductase n=1 Tax=Jatrophihabitans telluris TaxID=2038343 RepID=A0ABY4QUC7_9ACTN|nr:LLM class flavin-dependent oxidoreductase [Jatrophihabitans telluris]UQX87258.1 LLM class flavin-dependent oxidoreductase [Jatrophihabitans telluris]